MKLSLRNCISMCLYVSMFLCGEDFLKSPAKRLINRLGFITNVKLFIDAVNLLFDRARSNEQAAGNFFI